MAHPIVNRNQIRLGDGILIITAGEQLAPLAEIYGFNSRPYWQKVPEIALWVVCSIPTGVRVHEAKSLGKCPYTQCVCVF